MVAGSDSPHLLAVSAAAVSARYRAVTAVLVWVLFLNLAVAIAKLALGYLIGAVSIVSDGLHSLTDSFSNVAALVGVTVVGCAATIAFATLTWRVIEAPMLRLKDRLAPRTPAV